MLFFLNLRDIRNTGSGARESRLLVPSRLPEGSRVLTCKAVSFKSVLLGERSGVKESDNTTAPERVKFWLGVEDKR